MNDLTKIDAVGGIPIYSVKGTPVSFLFRTGFAIDADGSPNAYGPNNSGLDYTANGGNDQGGNWWGGPTGSDGRPLCQAVYDPSPGMYVSATSLGNPAYTEDSPYRYIDSESIPFFVLPGGHSEGAKLGDVGLVYNEWSGDNCYAIYGDVGPGNKIGEGSIRLAESLKINANPRTGGTSDHRIVYLVFPGSVGKWTTPKTWFGIANDLTQKWGGLDRLKTLIAQL